MEPNKMKSPTPPKSPPAMGADSPSTDVVGDVKDLATKVAGEAKELVAHKVSDRQERSAGDIGKMATAIRDSREGLADTVAGPYVDKAAAMLDRVSGAVRNASLGDTVRATERLARRDPVLFLGGAFVLGLVAGRFLKSSAQHPPEPQRQLGAGGSSPGAETEDTSRFRAQNGSLTAMREPSGRDGGF